ncbi:hypothetical protein [Lentilactobacillus hilgardii]|uniref:Uncharacterized protein n=1 Tax=Lentilactobacillus hilgardii (strain ATCC 8290 / DSM 20176 / CCUG 30140 / JCM 1155 / KCTC 3500 / NBRC 15886 / NCIMB 8040 / NRRL B-1843 / 9) TaxID=1423757 RepID=C0XK82_LENH9|nr:hypothetical protein [Lentilactobacillus hilgardii]EEI20364.1 hypothetical protein HMPREF0497_0854 [Lentilactobacillus buchneri ATCC 11577]EEI24266.1 hypothetical protein HMPREF0519_1643 [Lentilactobacillus hilgardii DSM 20176 = ATCC 8290]QIR08628.1 hypothetical protein G8J22_00562 [Lentilactobacillus hilgardii]TDG86307.1 hypothetical protein C5L34_001791 [Lentilactobacillus hilgardii]
MRLYDGKHLHIIAKMHKNTRKERIEALIGYGIFALLLVWWFGKKVGGNSADN